MDSSSSLGPHRRAIAATLTPISSPKRKRDYDSDSDYENPRSSPMRFRTELPSRPRMDEIPSPTSPQSNVSRQLHALKLNKPDLTFSTPVAAFGQGLSSTDSSGSWNTSSPSTETEMDSVIVLERSTSSIPQIKYEKIPPTPTLAPSLTSEPMPISPIPLPSPIQATEVNSPSKPNRLHSPPPPASNLETRTSPPPYADLTWTAAEITGHNPTDPADDGYGINGVGFRPTPAMAYARTQRRKQQVAEWKTREAKEARQKRMDRRKKLSAEIEHPGSAFEKRKVRFVDA